MIHSLNYHVSQPLFQPVVNAPLLLLKFLITSSAKMCPFYPVMIHTITHSPKKFPAAYALTTDRASNDYDDYYYRIGRYPYM